MKLRTVLVFDLLVFALMFLVSFDLQNRNQQALRPATYTYSILTQQARLSTGGVPYSSPLILDWFQVLILLFAAVNLYYLFSVARSPSPAVIEHVRPESSS